MAIDTSKYVDRVRRLGMENSLTLDPGDIEGTLDLALQALADKVAASDAPWRLQKTYTIAITSGLTADLNSGNPDLMTGALFRVSHPDAPTTFVPNLSDLDRPSNQMFYKWTIAENKIQMRKGDGLTAPANGNLTVSACYVPTISTVPYILEDNLVEEGYRLARTNAPTQ